MNLNIQKQQVRKTISEKKKEMSNDDLFSISEELFCDIEELKIFQNAQNILVYWSIKGEVFTHNFIDKWYKKKNILLPVVMGNKMIIKKYSGRELMVKSEMFNVLEPNAAVVFDESEIDLAIIPGIAFDKNNNRLGRGGGYYDRFLKEFKGCKLGLAFPFQVFNNVPFDEYDIKMDMVITKKGH